MVGTTTSVRDCAGMPAEKSIRGSGCGVTSSVASQFTSATANWLTASSERMPIDHSNQSGTPSACACANTPPLMIAAISAIAPRYSSNGNRPAVLRKVSAPEGRTCAARSSSRTPLSIR